MRDLPYGCLGRETEFNKLKDLMKCNVPIVIYGVAGVGKTAFCSYFYGKQREFNPNYFMLYVDMSGCREFEDFLQSISNAINIEVSASLNYLIEYLVEHCNTYQAILFDNWEEFQYSIVYTSAWEKIRGFLNLLSEHGIQILISSQIKVSNGWNEINLTELNPKDGEQLFKYLLLKKGKKIKKENTKEYRAFKQLLKYMENHPLTMVLTSSLVEGSYYDLSRIQDRWDKVYNEIEVGKHKSLRTALKMSFDAVSDIDGATLLWGIMAKLTVDFPVSFIELLKILLPKIKWDAAEYALVNRCLIRNTEMNGLHMLMPVKMQWKYLAESELQNKCLKKWGDLLPIVILNSDAPNYTHNPQKSNPLKKDVLMAMNDFMRITENLIENKLITKAEKCIIAMEPYYELVADQGFSFLEGLPMKKLSKKTQGLIYKCMADITRLKNGDTPNTANVFYESALSCFEECNDNSGIAYVKSTMGLNFLWNYKDGEKALKYFEESEDISRDCGFDICLAEALKNKGIVLTNEFAQDDAAKECFKESEEIYQKLGDYRGLAHVTKRIGIIELKKNNVDEALKCFEEALFFYEQTHYIQGVADTISRLCITYINKSDKEKLRKICNYGKKYLIKYHMKSQEMI